MREIVSPLDGIRSPLGGIRSPFAAYFINGQRPSLIADFRNNVFATRSLDAYDYALAGQPAALVTSFRDNAYLTSGRETMTAHTRHGLITSGRSTTMIVRDEDGIYKHGAHNLYRNGAGGAQAITVVSGRDYTIRMKGTGSIGYSGAATGTLSGTGADDVVRVEVTATTTTLTVTPSGSTSEIAVYQSDLGGMQLTSDGTDYVENETGAALYAAPVDYDVNGVRSMPIWEARTNLFLNSLALSTQGVTVTAQVYTVSFIGTGTITFSGAYLGFLVGTGANDRVSVSFTPSAGTLTCTVSGAVTYAQIEAGLGASPYIPTYGATATRAADNLYTLVSSFGYRQTEGTIVAEFESVGGDGADFPRIFSASDGGNNNQINALLNSVGVCSISSVVSGSGVFTTIGSFTPNAPQTMAAGYKSGDNAGSINGGSVGSNTHAMPSGIVNLRYGMDPTPANQLNGRLYSLAYYPFRAANSDLEAASA